MNSYALMANNGIDKNLSIVKKLPVMEIQPLASNSSKVGNLISLHKSFENNAPESKASLIPEETLESTMMINVPMVGGQFDFPALESELDKYTSSMGNMSSAPPMMDPFVDAMKAAVDQKPKIEKAKKIVDEAIAIGQEIQTLIAGNLIDLPVYLKQTIGNKDITIVIKSAKIYSKYAQLEVYIKIDLGKKDFEGNDAILYFGADKILFSKEKGVIQGNVGLVSDFAVKLDNSSKSGVVFKKMTSVPIPGEDPQHPDSYNYFGTFVRFDCSGFKELGVEATFVLSREWVIPTDTDGIPLTIPKDTDITTTTPRVHATIALLVQDWNDFMITVNLDPLVFANWQKVGFALTNATLDMSTYRNPPNFTYMDPIEWEGVFIENISITLPAPFKRSCGSFANTTNTSGTGTNTDSNNNGNNNPSASGEDQENANYEAPETCRTKISAENLKIDTYGVSGTVSVSGQVPLVGGGVVDGEWGFSMDSIVIGLTNSKIVQFYVEGELGAPIISKKTPLAYTCGFDFPMDKYDFSVSIPTTKPIEIPIFNAANVTLTNPTIGVEVENDEFDMWVKFQTAKLTIGKPNDYASNEKGPVLKLPSVTVTNMKLATRVPYFSFTGVSVESGDSTKVANFPVTVNNLNLTIPQGNPEELILGFDMNVNLMASSGNGVSATGYLGMAGEYIRNIDGTRSWKYKRFIFDGAQVTACFPQFYGKGTLKLLRDDPVYGTGFTATLEAGVIGKCSGTSTSVDDFKFQLKMTSIFGAMDSYRYFLVDGFVSGKTIKVPLFGPVYMDGFGGGVFHNMAPDSYIGDSGNTSVVGADLSGILYKPTTATKLGIKFATSIATADKVLDGLLTCIVRFDQNMALQNITFWGVADIAVATTLGGPVTEALDKLNERIETVSLPQKDIEDADKAEALAGEIRAKLGVSVDFAGGFAFHAYGEVTINLPGPNGNPLLTGSGTLDLLLDPSDDLWHLYIGGYYPNSDGIEVLVPDFFSGNEMVALHPVSATLDYGGFTVSASMYFLCGNTIPGPPPPPQDVQDFFDDDPDIGEDNRSLLTCGGNDPAMGTGIAYGASASIKFNKKVKGIFGSCVFGVKLNVNGGVGFDIALLKYGNNTACDLSGDSPHGLNGFRATGRIYAFVNIEGGHVTCLPMIPLGFGIKLRFDVPNPSYFEIKAVIKLGMSLELELGIGDECGTPCAKSVKL